MTTRILVLALTIGLVAAAADAAEYDRNPDRFPSLGLNLSIGGSSGTADLTASGSTVSQDYTSGLFELGADLRFPVSRSTTMLMGLTLVGNALEADETAFLAGQENADGGFIFNVGLRYYFNR